MPFPFFKGNGIFRKEFSARIRNVRCPRDLLDLIEFLSVFHKIVHNGRVGQG